MIVWYVGNDTSFEARQTYLGFFNLQLMKIMFTIEKFEMCEESKSPLVTLPRDNLC